MKQIFEEMSRKSSTDIYEKMLELSKGINQAPGMLYKHDPY